MKSILQTNKECWVDIKGYESLYQVSNLGNIKSKFKGLDKILKPFDNGHGYLVISLNKCGKRKNHYVHRLVASAFVNNPNGYKIINHLDYDTKNNNANNLEWCTQEQNINYSLENMKKAHICRTNTGEHHISRCSNRIGYRVRYKVKGINKEKHFKSFNDALEFRNKVYRYYA